VTPSEMRDAKARKIAEAAQGLGWEALVEIDGFEFTAYLEADNASAQMVEGKLSAAERILSDFGGPELYSLVEEYDLVPLGVHDAGKDLDEFVTAYPGGELYPPAEAADLEAMNEEHDAGEDYDERPSGLDLSDEGLEAMDAYINCDVGEEVDAADELCATCGNTGTQGVCPCGRVGACEIEPSPAWVTELAASVPEPVEGEGWEVPMNGLHEDPEYGDGRYTSPKETWAASQISDTPQNENEHEHGGPTLANNPKEVEMSENNENYVLTASRIIANGGFVIVARPKPTDQAEGFKIQRFASINRSHATALRDKFGYSIGIAARQ